jgi:tetratricopeptide (TPR) repeat protein
MPPATLRVFVSSTWLDLQPERTAVEEALARLRETKFIGMEHFGSRDETTRDVSLQEVEPADLYVGIVGGRYGSGITEAEYRRALELKLPCFIYFKDEANVGPAECDAEPDKAAQLARLKEDMRRRHTIGPAFSSPDDLAARLTADLHCWIETSAPQGCQVSLSRLPSTEPEVFGRSVELRLLDECWDDRCVNVVCLVAWGGVGKSALVNHWLAQMAKESYRGAKRVYAWSFYTQGTSDRVTSADEFIDAALTWFGDPEPSKGPPRNRGERLAELVRRQRTLLLLDGLEPLQEAPVLGGEAEGKLKDSALVGLLGELAAYNPGLCVLSTRVAVWDIKRFETSTVRKVSLRDLEPPAGAQLLQSLHVRGDVAELEAASREFGGHGLALTLLGSYLAEVHGGDIRKRGSVTRLQEDEQHGRHAQRVMASYERWFGYGPELAVLRLLSLFDRPADTEAVAALREPPAIPSLTEALIGLTDARWQQVLAKLRRAGLLAKRTSPNEPEALDTHPLIREHFGVRLRQDHPAAWREGNNRLYKHFSNRAPDLPGNFQEMAPLFLAVAHGCAAGQHQEVFELVYRPRILREAYFSTDALNAFGADLAAVAGFFAPRPDGAVEWSQPVSSLPDPVRAIVLRVAGWNLRSMGRMKEATQAFQAGVELEARLENRAQASLAAGQLCQIALDCGHLEQALEDAQQAQVFGEGSEQAFWRTCALVLRANVLFQLGRREDCEDLCRNIEEAGFPEDAGDVVDHTFNTFRWCDLQFGLIVSPCAPPSGRVDPEAVRRVCDEIQARCEQLLRRAEAEAIHIPLATDVANLLRARRLVVRGAYGGAGEKDLGEGVELLNGALHNLKARAQEFYLSGLRAWVALHLHRGRLKEAEEALDEAMAVATRSELRLYEVDAHLQFAWLHLARQDKDAARKSLDGARALISKLNYKRRNTEIAEIENMLNGTPGGAHADCPHPE